MTTSLELVHPPHAASEQELRILLLEDIPIDAELTERELRRAGMSFSFQRVATRRRFVRALDTFRPELILADYALPQFTGLDALELVRERGLDVPFLLVTGTQTEEIAVECMRKGADDYVLKSSLTRLPAAIQNAVLRRETQRERRRLNEELGKSTRQILTIFESITDAFFAVDEDWRLIYLNRQSGHLFELVGKRPEELWGRVWWEEFPLPSDGEGAQLLLHAMRSRVRVEFEEYLPTFGMWMYVRAYPAEDGLSIYAQDVSDRRKSKDTAQAWERRFRAIIENNFDAFALVDKTGALQYLSPSSEEILGYSEEELRGRSLLEHVHPDDRARLDGLFSSLLRKGGALGRTEFRMRHKDGSWRWIEAVGKNHLGQENIDAVVMNYRDVTDRKLTEEQLAFQARVLQQVSDAVISVDTDFRVLSWNTAAEQLYGCSSAEAVGRPLDDLFKGRGDSFARGLASDRARNGVWRKEVRQYRADGAEIIVDVSATELLNRDGAVIGYVGIHHDRTEQKRLEQQFLRAQRLESIGTLAGGIAHDLNNVLTPVIMAIPMLRQYISDVSALSILETLESSVRRGEGIVKQVLAFAKGVKGERAPIQIRSLVHELITFLRETVPPSIRMEARVPRDLWLVHGDATQLYQVLMNLAINARDAMPEGGKLTFSARNIDADGLSASYPPDLPAGRYLEVSITDTGTGIDEEIMGKIFDPFFTTKESGKGTGLGLFTVLSIIQGHDGRIEVKSAKGRGTQFLLFLPATATEAGEKIETTQSPPRGNGELVMVVDDEECVRDLLQSVLESVSYRVVTAPDGAEAVGLFAQHRDEISAVVMDLLMPVMDGPSTLRALQRIRAGIPVIGMSGMLPENGSGELFPQNVPFLQKPFSMQAIATALRDVLDQPAEADRG